MPMMLPHRMWRQVRAGLEIVTTLAVMAAALTILVDHFHVQSGLRPSVSTPKSVPTPVEPIPIGDSPVEGDPHAKVVVIAFSDFQCPYCGRFARETLPVIEDKYVRAGHLAFVFKNYPLTSHRYAETAALLGVCADRQGAFWNFHNEVFRRQSELGDDILPTVAADVGINRESLVTCEQAAKPVVQRDRDLARTLRISGTPTFFVGRRQGNGVLVTAVLMGMQTVAQFDQALAELVH